MLDGIKKQLNLTTNQRMQMMFYNDNTFEFRNLPLQDGSLVVRENEGIKQAWPSFNKLLKDFPGHAGLNKGRVLISCENDIIFDMFNELNEGEKPEKGGGLVKAWIKNKADAVRYRHQSKPGASSAANKVVLFLGIALVLELLMWLLVAAQKVYSTAGVIS